MTKTGLSMNIKTLLAIAFLSLLPALSPLCAETLPTNQPNNPDVVTSDTALSYFVEISISRNLLTLFEKGATRRRAPWRNIRWAQPSRGSIPIRLDSAGLPAYTSTPGGIPPSTPGRCSVSGDRAPRGGPARAPAELHGTVQDRPVTPDEQRGHLPDPRQQQPEAGRPAGHGRVLRHG